MKRHLLIVADEETANNLNQLLNNGDDFEVVGMARDTQTGLQLALERRPQIVLLYLYLPNSTADQFKLSGLAIPDAIRSFDIPSILHILGPYLENTVRLIKEINQQLQSIIILLLPHSLASEQLEQLVSAGVNYCLVVPRLVINFYEELLEIVRPEQ